MIKSQTIYTPYASDRFIVPLNNNGFYYDLFKQDNPYPVDIIDKTKKIKLVKENHHLPKGEILFLHKHTDIFSFSKENTETVMFLSLSLKKEDPFVWEYNLQNLLPTKIETRNSQLSSRLEQMLTLVGELNNEVSIPYLFKLLEYPDFNVRWESAKAIMNINFDDGVKALNILKDDKHPEIIKAVNKAFSQLIKLKLI
ncbi:MAG: HEAT repeat domain-containing protein [Polaribacter sp.]